MKALKTKLHEQKLAVDGCEEVICSVMGNVDAGKSSLIGLLVSGVRDDGKGLSRSYVFKHPHEMESGRTSDISTRYIKLENRIITFVDLAGHEKYLTTTIHGACSMEPDFGIIVVSDKITAITKEHMRLLAACKIPFIVVQNKIDAVPKDKVQDLQKTINKLVASTGVKMIKINTAEEAAAFGPNFGALIPYVKCSTVSLEGIEVLKAVLLHMKKRIKHLIKGFPIDCIYHPQTAQGHVFTGYAGIEIAKNDRLYLGPFSDGSYLESTVKSLHNDYRLEVDKLSIGQRGCICMKIPKEKRHLIKSGMVLLKEPVAPYEGIVVRLYVLHHSTTIKEGYEVHMHAGSIKHTGTFVHISPTNDAWEPIQRRSVKAPAAEGTDTTNTDAAVADASAAEATGADSTSGGANSKVILRSNDKAIVSIKFKYRRFYLERGAIVIFREGSMRAFGKVEGFI
jgi:elongation factor 1-alpha